MTPRLRVAVVLAALSVLAGCGGEDAEPDPDRAAVADTIRAAAATAAGDEPGEVCTRLTERGRQEVERRGGAVCPRAVERLAERLPGPGRAALRRVVVRDVRVTGARAAALAEPPSDLVELARASGVTSGLVAKVELVRRGTAWLIDAAAPAR